MKINFIRFLICVCLLILGGCESTTVVGRTYPAVPIDSVQVLYQEPKRPYEVLAFVQSNKSWEMSSAADVADLRKKAARVGADALLVTSVHGVTMTEWDAALGKAIKWTSKE
jgi:hypothetical protein